MKVQVKQSKRVKICIIYHPNPTEINKEISKVKEILEG